MTSARRRWHERDDHEIALAFVRTFAGAAPPRPSRRCFARRSTPAATTAIRTRRWRSDAAARVAHHGLRAVRRVGHDRLRRTQRLWTLSAQWGHRIWEVQHLDAVCFALYGDVPGDRSTAKRLRSDLADPATAPRVQLNALSRADGSGSSARLLGDEPNGAAPARPPSPRRALCSSRSTASGSPARPNSMRSVTWWAI